MRAQKAIIPLLLVTLVLVACGLVESPQEAEEASQATPDLATPITIVDPQSTPLFEIPPTATPAAVELKVWIPPQIAVRTEEGAQILADQLQTFNNKHPDVAVKVEQKQSKGAGGILSYLRTGRGVASSVLPDVIVLPTEQLPAAGSENLIFPLDGEFDVDEMDALFPSAEQLARTQEEFLGYPFALSDLSHLVYNSNVLTSTLPLTWERLITNPERRMVMAAGGDDGALLTLQFYLDAGGKVEDEGQPVLEIDALQVALDALEDGRESGFIVTESSSLGTEDQAWQIFLGGGASIVRTSSDHFLGEITAGLPVEYTVTPGIDRPLTPLTTGWAWAVTTSDPARRALANELILDLVAAPNLGAWSQESDILPSRRDALETWSRDGAYTGFIQQELERAHPMPVASSSKLLTVLGDAAFQVLSGEKTAEQAAEDAVTAFEA